jgi:T5SS/PEP-CTERM-associated repeat protein
MDDQSSRLEDGEVTSEEFGTGDFQIAQADGAGEAIGSIQELSGTVTLTRTDGTIEQASVGSPVYLNDTVATSADGAVEIVFVDGMTFSLGGNAEMDLNNLVYNPGGSGNALDLSVVKGAFVFITGNIAPAEGEGVKIDTPAGTIGIRGTSGGGTQDPQSGGWVFSLFVDPDGKVGRIVITNAAGTVVLDEALETTEVASALSQPSQTFILTEEQAAALFSEALASLQDLLNLGADPEGVEPEAGDGQLPPPDPASLLGDLSEIVNGLATGTETLLEIISGELTENFGSQEQSDGTTTTNLLGDTESGESPNAPSSDGGTTTVTDNTYNPTTPPPPDLTGDDGDNVITGTGGAELIEGLGGNDSLAGGGGNDTVEGGTGSDTIDGGAGNDTVVGGEGNDFIDGGDGTNVAVFSGPLADYTILVDGGELALSADVATSLALVPPDAVITVIGPDGTDTLTNVDVLRFSDKDVFVGGPNHAPEQPVDADGDANSVAEDATVGTEVGIDADSFDPDLLDEVTFTLSDDAGGLFAIDPVTGVVTVAGALDFETADSHQITVRATDSSGEFSEQTFAIDVTDVFENDPPTATDDGPLATAEDTALTIAPAALLGNDDDPDGDTLTIQSVQGAVNGTVGFDEGGNVVFTPTADYSGPASFTYTVSDGNGGTDTATVTINVTAVNDVPVISSDGGGGTASVNVTENTAAVTTVTATDVDGPTKIFSIVGGADSQLFQIDSLTSALSFVSAPDFENPASSNEDNIYEVQVQVSDGAGGIDTQTISVTVTNANDNAPSTPIDTNNNADTVAEDAAVGAAVGITAFSTDLDGDSVTYSLTDDAGGLFAIDPVTGVVTVAGALDFETAESHQITVQASDGTNTSTKTFTIGVTDANDNLAPVASDAFVYGGEDQGAIQVILGGTDGDGTVQSVTLISLPTNGTLYTDDSLTTEAQTGVPYEGSSVTFYFVPDENFNGDATFQYTVTDNQGASDATPATATITVDPVNDDPVITSDGGGDTANVDVAENSTTVTTVTATDVDGPTKIFSIVGGADSQLFQIDSLTGALSFVSAPDFENPASSNEDNIYEVQVQVSDGAGGIDTQTINVTVTDLDDTPPDAPVITGFSDDTGEPGDGITGDNTLIIEGTAEAGSTVEIFQDGQSIGTTTANVDGFWSFGPTDPLTNATYQFTATATDQAGNTSDASTALEVTIQSATPTAVSDSNIVDEGAQSAANGSAMKTTVTVAAGAVLTFDFNFLDSEPPGEGGEANFKDFAVLVINGQVFTLADVDDATSPLGALTTEFNEETGYTTYTFTFTEAGTYDVGLAVLNEGDTLFDAGLLVDSVSISDESFDDGFESGLEAWEILGTVTTESTVEGILPTDGEQQALLVSNGAETSAIEAFLGLAPGTLLLQANQPIASGNVLGNDDFGGDGEGGIVGITYAGNPADVVDPNGTTVDNVTTITATDGSWKLEFDLVTGDYTFTVLAPLDHPEALADSLSFAFSYTIEDATGDSSSATLTIDVVDGVPIAIDDFDGTATAGGGDVTGNVLLNDLLSSDGVAVTEIILAGSSEPIAVSASEPLNVETSFGGTLIVSADGSWTYTPPATLPGGEPFTDGFTYTVTDGDGDQSTATLSISVVDGGNSEPLLTNGGAATVVCGTEVIDADELSATDSNNTPEQIEYKITGMTNGVVYLEGVALVVGANDSFTQADIDAGLVYFRHDGEGSMDPAGFTFTYSDGTFTSDSQTFTIAVGFDGNEVEGDIAGDVFAFESVIIGSTAVGALTIVDTSVVNVSSAVVGDQAGSFGYVCVSGPNADFDVGSIDISGSLVVSNAGTGELRIENGAKITITSDNFDNLIIGGASGGKGTVIVSGAGSTLTTIGTDNTIQVGQALGSTGYLLVEDGAVVSTLELDIGRFGTGQVDIVGAGSQIVVSNDNGLFSGGFAWEAGYVSIGAGGFGDSTVEGGDGTLNVMDGGQLLIRDGIESGTVAPGMQIARAPGSAGIVNVSGEGSSIDIVQSTPYELAHGGPFLSVGREGDGALNITAGGAVTLDGPGAFMVIGEKSMGIGTVLVSGIGQFETPSTLTVAGTDATIRVGGAGTGELTVSDGGLVETLFLEVARDGTGTTTIDGGAVHASNEFGSFTDDTGEFLLDDGGFVRVGRNSGSNGTLNVVNGGVLLIDGTETADDMGLQIAREEGSIGTVLVNGAGSTISIFQDPSVDPVFDPDLQMFEGGPFLQIGCAGQGVMVIANVGLVELIGQESFVQVGRGNADEFASGEAPILEQSELLIASGGALVVDGLTNFAGMNIGQEANGDGLINVIGVGSKIEISGVGVNLAVGRAGAGDLFIADQGTVVLDGTTDFAVFEIGALAGSDGYATVTGTGSALSVSGNYANITVGSEGVGELVIEEGADAALNTTSGGDIHVGFFDGGSGHAVVTGSGSTLKATGTGTDGGVSLLIGGGGSGQLEVLAGGLVLLDSPGFNDFVIGADATGIGVVDVNGTDEFGTESTISVMGDGSEMTVGVNGTATLSIAQGGQVTIGSASAGTSYVGRYSGSLGLVTVDGAGSQLGAGADLVIGFVAPEFDTTAGGSGTVMVTNGGTVSAGTAGDGLVDSDIWVGSGGTLGGDGTVVGDVNVVGGTILPGVSPGTFAIDGDLIVNSGKMEFELGGTGASQHDLIAVTGEVLVVSPFVTFEFTYAPDTGDSIEIISAGAGIDPSLEDVTVKVTGLDLTTGFDFEVNIEGTEGGPESYVMNIIDGAILGNGIYFEANSSSWNFAGDTGADVLVGDTGNDTLSGGIGDDTIEGGSGADKLYGGADDDSLIVSDLLFSEVDGGEGQDRLVLEGSGIELDLSTVAIAGIEEVNLGGFANTLILAADDVLDVSDTDILLVDGTESDTVAFSGDWTAATEGGTNGDGTSTFGDQTYQIYTASGTGGTATALVDIDISFPV